MRRSLLLVFWPLLTAVGSLQQRAVGSCAGGPGPDDDPPPWFESDQQQLSDYAATRASTCEAEEKKQVC